MIALYVVLSIVGYLACGLTATSLVIRFADDMNEDGFRLMGTIGWPLMPPVLLIIFLCFLADELITKISGKKPKNER